MQAAKSSELTSKLKLDKIEKQTQPINGGGYIFSKPSKGKQEEDYSKYIK